MFFCSVLFSNLTTTQKSRRESAAGVERFAVVKTSTLTPKTKARPAYLQKLLKAGGEKKRTCKPAQKEDDSNT